MPQHEYSAADITIVEFDAAIRRAPGMYFWVAADSPALPSNIVGQTVSNALHPDTYAAPWHSAAVRVEIIGDLAFTVTDDNALPTPGYYESLLGHGRLLTAAAAVFGKRTIVEVWQDYRGLHQHLDHLHPIAPAREFTPATARGTRITCHLDPALLAPGATIAADLSAYVRHLPDCDQLPPCDLVIRDLR
ncbi:MAG TPA: hypothetical protein VGN81_18320 [Pseudonocardiaceae bacterium]